MTLILIAVNTFGWLVLQLGIAWGVTKMNARHFANDGGAYAVRAWEIGFYRRWLRIRRWKGMLPDGAPWVGGSFRKKHLAGRDTAYLRQFALETRRGEAAHWLSFACFPVFFLWNPHWAWIVMALYAAAANLPCVVVQRYNREAVRLLLLHRER
jgi:glycosyl-4,4'-diaponeurosporenoate acyltransferase